jgi:uncharacterized protein (TIGR02996 family)
MTPDFVALHLAVLEGPDDDGPRLTQADWYERNGKVARAELLREDIAWPSSGIYGGRAIFCRGFVEAAILNVDTFLVHGAEIFGDHPITHVEFVDLEPAADVFGPGTWGWITGFTFTDNVDIDLALIDYDFTSLPDTFADAVEGRDAAGPVFTGKVYGSKQEAVEELSGAAVRVGREAAGLGPLVGMPVVIESK